MLAAKEVRTEFDYANEQLGLAEAQKKVEEFGLEVGQIEAVTR